jgi:hypothetical protein
MKIGRKTDFSVGELTFELKTTLEIFQTKGNLEEVRIKFNI